MASTEALAPILEVDTDDIMIESTGVIGQRIKTKEMFAALPALVQSPPPRARSRTVLQRRRMTRPLRAAGLRAPRRRAVAQSFRGGG